MLTAALCVRSDSEEGISLELKEDHSYKEAAQVTAAARCFTVKKNYPSTCTLCSLFKSELQTLTCSAVRHYAFDRLSENIHADFHSAVKPIVGRLVRSWKPALHTETVR